MKGVVFTEFVDMVEDKFGIVVVDRLLEESANGGSYTAVGDYDYRELIGMVVRLAKETDMEIGALVEVFGKHLFTRFEALYPQFFEGVDAPLDFLEHIEDRIHSEVRKLYPTADLPTFATKRDGNSLEMVYRSPRCLGALAVGLIRGCLERYGTEGTIAQAANDDGSEVRFTITVNE